jgi:geranylgeranyl diphosphate synthase, type II
MKAFVPYQEAIANFLAEKNQHKEPRNLYEPIEYILGLGGKRLRPALVIAAANSYGATIEEALPAAAAIEVFHNFTLVHDDIMDDAALRRGHSTVHEKWNLNTGILSGDAMLIEAYQFLETYKAVLALELLKIFNKTALEVCEGQQYDVDFETRDQVAEHEYLKMIQFKTAVLVGAALQMGALVGGATRQDSEKLYHFGLLLGTAFQIQDDYLDAFGSSENFGKTVGGDIIENKKTLLYIKAFERADADQKTQLQKAYSLTNTDEKITAVKNLFVATGAESVVKTAVKAYTDKALDVLNELSLEASKKELFSAFAAELMVRNL